MKRFHLYLSLMLLLGTVAACTDNFDDLGISTPVAKHTPNMTIAEFKAKYWQDEVNYIDTIKEDIVIHGWVTSTDVSGNIYKCLYIDDGTAGLSISINQNNLCNKYRIGQEVVLPLKDCYIGKYNGQQQIGFPAWYQKGRTWEATFLPQYVWESMVELNGLPDPSKVDTLEVTLDEFCNKFTKETLLKYQAKLVRINGVYFRDAGEVPFSEENSSTNRTIYDDEGNELTLRNSNYADFRSKILPKGKVDIIGMLGSYSSSTWQLYLRTIDDVISIERGEKGNPYSVGEAIDLQGDGKNAWLEGYAVGAVVPGVTTVASNDDIEWTAPVTAGTTMVLAPDANCKDYTQCVIVNVPEGSEFYDKANLADYPVVLKSLVTVKGEFRNQYGRPGVVTSGSLDSFKLSVNTGPATELVESFDSQLPVNWNNVTVSGNMPWSWSSYSNDGYAIVTGYQGTPPFDMWLVTSPLDIEHAAQPTLSFRTKMNLYNSTESKFEVYILDSPDPREATVKEQLNATLAAGPSPSGWSDWVTSGAIDLSKWNDGIYYIGFRYSSPRASRYSTWQLDDVKFGVQ